jgi:transketolase
MGSRATFGIAILLLAEQEENLMVLSADLGKSSGLDRFCNAYPSNFLNVGIAEQNMVGMAAGLARLGFRPFVYGLAAFIPIRTVEQIKLDIAHDALPVVLLGDGAGFVYSHLGTSHQSTEDIACTRSIPGLQILSPADRFEMTACMDYAGLSDGPLYLRMGKADRGDVHASSIAPLQPGQMIKIRDGRADCPGLIATGSMLYTAVSIAESQNLKVWSAPMIKPLHADQVCSAAQEANGLVTLEEHSVLGGLGSAVAEILTEHHPSRLVRIGVEDKFSENCGTYNYLLEEHGLNELQILNRMGRVFDFPAFC